MGRCTGLEIWCPRQRARWYRAGGVGAFRGRSRRAARVHHGVSRPCRAGHLVPAAGGQPATAAAWTSPDVDRAAGEYYSSTYRSIETAWVRPRRQRWIALQDKVSEMVRDAIVRTTDSAEAVE